MVDKRTGRTVKRGINVRITPEQDDSIRQLAEQDGISDSEALRQLLDLGRLQLVEQGDDVIVSFRAGLTPAMLRAVGLDPRKGPAAHGGLVVMTGEQGDTCDDLASDA